MRKRWESIREGVKLLNGWMKWFGRSGGETEAEGDEKGQCEWEVRASGTQDDNNRPETVVVRIVECAWLFQKEIMIVCSFRRRRGRETLSKMGG